MDDFTVLQSRQNIIMTVRCYVVLVICIFNFNKTIIIIITSNNMKFIYIIRDLFIVPKLFEPIYEYRNEYGKKAKTETKK